MIFRINGKYFYLHSTTLSYSFNIAIIIDNVSRIINDYYMQGRNDRGQELHIYLEGDAKKLFKVIRQEGNNYQKQTGNPVFG